MSIAYYYGSAVEIGAGARLKVPGSRRGSEAVRALKSILEARRPRIAAPRMRALLLSTVPSDIRPCGREDAFVYRVEPGSLVTMHDYGWYVRAGAALGNGMQDEADRCARAYWSGIPCPDGASSVREYMTISAVVTGRVS